MSNSKHYNIQIHIQEVEHGGIVLDGRGFAVKGAMGVIEKSQRSVLTLLDLKIGAPTESEAYDRVLRLLETNRPDPVEHLHRASCHGAGGNLVCGFPPGRTIAG